MVRHVAWMCVVLATTSAGPPRAPGNNEEVARLYKEDQADRTPPSGRPIDWSAVLPRDPFDGKPLRMAARDGRLVFYSIGPDMKGDGGTALDEKNSTGDITFSLPLNLAKSSETH